MVSTLAILAITNTEGFFITPILIFSQYYVGNIDFSREFILRKFKFCI